MTATDYSGLAFLNAPIAQLDRVSARLLIP